MNEHENSDNDFVDAQSTAGNNLGLCSFHIFSSNYAKVFFIIYIGLNILGIFFNFFNLIF